MIESSNNSSSEECGKGMLVSSIGTLSLAIASKNPSIISSSKSPSKSLPTCVFGSNEW